VQCLPGMHLSQACQSSPSEGAASSTRLAWPLARQACPASASRGRPSLRERHQRLGRACRRAQTNATSLGGVRSSADACPCPRRGPHGSGRCGGPVTCRGDLANASVSGGGACHDLGLGGLRGGRPACCRGLGRGHGRRGHDLRRNDRHSGHASGRGVVLETASAGGGAASIVHGRGRTLSYQRGASPCRLVVCYCLGSVQVVGLGNRVRVGGW
jgi:hypothetical protein